MIRTILSVLTTLVWALWLGGLVALFLCVVTLFRADRAIAVEAAPRMFRAFAQYQAILAAAGIAGAALWAIVAKNRLTITLLVLTTLAGIGAAMMFAWITPTMQAMQRGTPEFGRLHGIANGIYLAGTVLLMGAGLVLPAAIKRTQ